METKRTWDRMGNRPRAVPNCTCEICGKTFHKAPSAIANGEGKFCSTTCYATALRQRVGPQSPKWKGGPGHWDRTGSGEWKDCAGCGKHFFAKQKILRYCSITCHHRHVVHKPTPGHRQVTKTGYIRLTLEDGSRVLEHRWVWEKAHGISLNPKQQIHHLNHIKTDNRLENLRLFGTAKEHLQHHWQENPEFRKSPKGIPRKKRAATA